MWIIQLIIEILKFAGLITGIAVDAKKKADAANEKFVIDQAKLKEFSDLAWAKLLIASKADSAKADSAWDKADQDNTPPGGKP